MADFGGIAGEQLKSLIERIERLEDEKRALGEDIKEVYAEAKGTGFEPKIMRQLIKIRKMDKDEHDEQESLLDLYKRALGMLPEAGATAQAAEQARALPLIRRRRCGSARNAARRCTVCTFSLFWLFLQRIYSQAATGGCS